MNGWIKPTGAQKYHFYKAGEEESACGNWRRSAMPSPVSEVSDRYKCPTCAKRIAEERESLSA